MNGDESYQIVFLGTPNLRPDALAKLIGERVTELGLSSQTIAYLQENEYSQRNIRLPTVAIFVGYEGADDVNHPAIEGLLEDSQIVITIVSSLVNVSSEIPESLRHINAIAAILDDRNLDRVVSLILESFRLLRKERRLFISYKRDDAQSLANQLYNALDAHGFDVFIDTRSVPPAVDFQAELWHRLSDSDVVVLIDTPGFRQSRWTTEELARANATNIQILHLLWPGQPEDGTSSFSHFYKLSACNFSDFSLPSKYCDLISDTVESICNFAERLRAKAIAARHRYLVDGFCDAARDHGLAPTVQPERWISVEIAPGKELAVVPTIGVPTSDRINQISDAISSSRSGSAGTWVLYDNRGMLGSWLQHLDWLDTYLPARSLKMASAYEALRQVAK